MILKSWRVSSTPFFSITHDWYRKNELSGYEGYYANIFYEKYAKAFSPIYLIWVDLAKMKETLSALMLINADL